MSKPNFKIACECGCGLSLEVDDVSSPFGGEAHISIQIQDRRHFFTRKRTSLDMVIDQAGIQELYGLLGNVLAEKGARP